MFASADLLVRFIRNLLRFVGFFEVTLSQVQVVSSVVVVDCFGIAADWLVLSSMFCSLDSDD